MAGPPERCQPPASLAVKDIHRRYASGSNLLPLVLFLAFVPSALASSKWYVDGVNGSDNNDCKSPQTACKTIGHAISLASSGDSILIAPAIYRENPLINISLQFIGSGARTTIIDGNRRYPVVDIDSPADVTIAKLTIRNGSHGGIYFDRGTLNIRDSIVSGNSVRGRDAFGAGIENSLGTVQIDRSTIIGNESKGFSATLGGGVYNSGGTMTINRSTISGNRSSGGFGGGIANFGTMTISNSTISGNKAAFGGGVENDGLAIINNTTISNNKSKGKNSGGGLANDGFTVILRNSIVANNHAGGDCYGGPISRGYNLSSDKTCNFFGHGDRNNTDPKLGPLRNNGGPTQTHALLQGSPAIDAGNPKGCTDGHGHLLKTDQRGKPRPDKEDKSGCDMGAYERQSD